MWRELPITLTCLPGTWLTSTFVETTSNAFPVERTLPIFCTSNPEKVDLHPRGDGREEPCGLTRVAGGPPPSWRRLLQRGLFFGEPGLTSTSVKTTCPRRSGASGIQVDLHARGDDAISSKISKECHGRPPRVWRERPGAARHGAQGRKTSTLVKMTSSMTNLQFGLQVDLHPREDDGEEGTMGIDVRGRPPLE